MRWSGTVDRAGDYEREHEGQTIGFTGVLANVDRFGRKIWVRHADLV